MTPTQTTNSTAQSTPPFNALQGLRRLSSRLLVRATAAIRGADRITQIVVLDREGPGTRNLWLLNAQGPEIVMGGRFLRWTHDEGSTLVEADLLACAHDMDENPPKPAKATVTYLGA